MSAEHDIVIFLVLATLSGNVFDLTMADCCRIFSKPIVENTDTVKRQNTKIINVKYIETFICETF